MPRVMLIHWKAAEIEERAARLRKAGFSVEGFSTADGIKLRGIRDDPPDVFVIDLARLPSHGRAVGVSLRQTKSTRSNPLVFVGDDPKKIARVRKELPDAIYTNWRGIAGAMKKALAWKNEKPVNPGVMAGYSGTPLPKKLGVDGDRTVLLMGAPDGFESMIETDKANGRIRRGGRGTADVVMLFAKTIAEFKKKLPAAKKAMADGGGLWIAWPKKASGMQTDLSEPVVRKTGLASGLVDYKICAIDDTWSGLKFARRK